MYSRVLNACQENTLSKLIQISNRSYIATKSALTEKVKRELDRIERDCVVICINLRDLNTAILSEDFSFKSIEDVIAEIAPSGLWPTRLDAVSSKLCTFTVTHHQEGRYSFTRLPFGNKSALEVYQRKI